MASGGGPPPLRATGRVGETMSHCLLLIRGISRGTRARVFESASATDAPHSVSRPLKGEGSGWDQRRLPARPERAVSRSSAGWRLVLTFRAKHDVADRDAAFVDQLDPPVGKAG